MRITSPFNRRLQPLALGLGSAASIAILVLFALLLPLSIVALVRLFGWEWWSALIAAVIIAVIPVFGQLAYAILVVVGAYYFVEANFDWREATEPAAGELSVSTMSTAQFNAFRNNIYSLLERGCKEDGKRNFAVDGQIPVSVTQYCECYARVASSVFTKADYAYQEMHGDVPEEAAARFKAAVAVDCVPERQ